MNGLLMKGDVKFVTEQLEALAYYHKGETVGEITAMFNRMTDEQKAFYMDMIVACNRLRGAV